MRLFKPYKVLLILGNGFDLSLGLRTSYNDFIESDLFKKRVAIKYYPNSKIDEHDKNIYNYLILQKRLKNWIDVEMELMHYASQQRVEYHKEKEGLLHTSYLSNRSDDIIQNSYKLLCRDLQIYMRSLNYEMVNEGSLSLNLLKMVLAKKNSEVITFNYTDIGRLVSKPRGSVEFMHGNINDGIILGFQRFENMALGYDYMIKSENTLYKSRHLAEKMLNADEVIIYGHSLGETDHCYFKPFFEEQVGENAKPRRLTIFTLNGESSYNITQQMVVLTDKKYQLFQDNTDVNIIRTANNVDMAEAYIVGLKKRISGGLFNRLSH